MQGSGGMRCGLKCRVVQGWGAGDRSSKTNRLFHAQHLSIYLSIYLANMNMGNTKNEYLSVEMEATGGGLAVGDAWRWKRRAEIHRRRGDGRRRWWWRGQRSMEGGEAVEVGDAVGEVLKCMRGWTGSVEVHGERCGDGREMLAEREYGDPCGEEVR